MKNMLKMIDFFFKVDESATITTALDAGGFGIGQFFLEFFNTARSYDSVGHGCSPVDGKILYVRPWIYFFC
jgi:hypothetical protein